MAKTTVAKLFKAYLEAVRVQLTHYGDRAGEVASESSSVIVSALKNCHEEVEITQDVETAIKNIS